MNLTHLPKNQYFYQDNLNRDQPYNDLVNSASILKYLQQIYSNQVRPGQLMFSPSKCLMQIISNNDNQKFILFIYNINDTSQRHIVCLHKTVQRRLTLDK